MSAYNLYRGNGGRARRVEDPPSAQTPPTTRQTPPKTPPKSSPAGKLPILGDLPRKLSELETEDVLLILILYLMYRESGDKELLVIMGAMYLL